MKWFARKKPEDVWDEAIEGPIGDIAAAERIRAICLAATASAEALGGSGMRADKGEGERYERAARAAMEIAMKISDDLMRDDAVSRIVALCMKANDAKTARILSRAIQAGWIREAVQRDYPVLSD
ncbi:MULTISPECIES: hypothetical protein [unclassified Bradyrhizobium]|uniref:hypothetical protein n=1 Tax=unclassified Bradyrhizobium TaxID=2631580 RepID=UPI00247B09E2|nr:MULTISPECIES: hypothetical protein [unclassified Bradyrhizobium]WGR69810.1 hypothetical protein MTX24_31090 [Bradyrhizobium sp. ISRA426]WGR81866.1 hypothetical protein MTX21_16200 [Bradyrhizobium sp. ISRA430]WGR85052.1 hypothetical protein MTX25_30765 [Bradyrhizobium sp. ISRA432]